MEEGVEGGAGLFFGVRAGGQQVDEGCEGFLCGAMGVWAGEDWGDLGEFWMGACGSMCRGGTHRRRGMTVDIDGTREQPGGGAALLDGVWAGLADGFEGVQGELTAAGVGEGRDVGEPGGEGPLGKFHDQIEEVFAALDGEGGGVLAQGEEAGEEGAVLWREGWECGGKRRGDHEGIMIAGGVECKGEGVGMREKGARFGVIGRVGARGRVIGW